MKSERPVRVGERGRGERYIVNGPMGESHNISHGAADHSDVSRCARCAGRDVRLSAYAEEVVALEARLATVESERESYRELAKAAIQALHDESRKHAQARDRMLTMRADQPRGREQAA